MATRILIFLAINFLALALGGLFTGSGVPSTWYQQLDKAPWTPPGWMFGAAWTTIMVCYGVYMAYLWPRSADRNLLLLVFSIQWILNVSWNPIFFHFHLVGLGLLVISLLAGVVLFQLLVFRHQAHWWSMLLVPYAVWLVIATSLNAYIVFNNQ